MKKIVCAFLVAMITVTMAFAQVIVVPMPVSKSSFTIKNKTNDDFKTVSTDDFTTWVDGNPSYTVNLDGGIYKGEGIEITYQNRLLLGTPYLTWFYGWNANDAGSFAPLAYKGTGLTQTFSTDNIPSNASMLIVKCNYKTDEQSSETKTYIMYINVINGNRITVKNSDASEVQVFYTNHEDVVSYAGQRATVALYDIYGNPVSTGYLDNLGMSTLSTKGKPGIYIVKVIMNNQVIFSQRIQVK